MEDKISIKAFDLSTMAVNPAILMIAKRGTGKSWICRAIINYFSKIPVGIIISPTERMNCFYGNFFPESYIHNEYTSELIRKILHRQEIIIEKKQDRLKNGKKTVDTRALLIMDDCLSQSKTWANDKYTKEILFNGRHYDLMYILTMQYSLGIGPILRGQFDYVFLLAESFESNLKRLYEQYAGMFPSFDDFKETFAVITKDWGAMVIVMTSRGEIKAKKSEQILDSVFWFRAQRSENIKIGCRQFNEFHEKNYNPNWRKKLREIESRMTYKGKNKKSIIRVTKAN